MAASTITLVSYRFIKRFEEKNVTLIPQSPENSSQKMLVGCMAGIVINLF